jgi:chemotaxis protein MotB
MTIGSSSVYAVIASALVTITAAGGWTAYYLEHDAAKQQHRQATNTQTELARKIAALQTDYKALRTDYEALRREHRALRAKSGRIEGQLASTIAERDDLNSRLGAARSEQTQLAGELKAMLSERDRLTAELNAATGAQDSLRAKLKANSEQIRAKEAALEGSQQRSEELRDRLQAQLDSAINKQAELRGQLESTDEQIQAKESELQDSRHRIEALITALDTANARILELAAEVDQEKEARRRDSERFARLETELEAELQSKDVQIERLRDDLTVISVGGDILFNTGSAELRPGGARALRLIAKVLKEYPERDVSIEGHTDNTPIGEPLSETYPTNWELSAARAARAVRFLQTEAGIEPDRLRVVGYGEHRPVAPNNDPEHKARNRRIEIMLLPRMERRTVDQAQLSKKSP